MQPDAFQLDHAGFAAEFRPTREERRWSVAFVFFAPLWNALVCFGIWNDGGLQGTTCCMLTTVVLIWFVAWLGIDSAVTRRTLRLANGQLDLETRKLGTRRERVPLHGLVATAREQFTSKGGRIHDLVLARADGVEHVLSASNWRTADLESLARLLNDCAVQVDPESQRVPPDALVALLGKAGAVSGT
ncbi:MAG: hypothetical protein R3F61_04980 [Myxococcota bacterium]